MNELKIFNNPEFGSIRTVNIGSETWFLGKDIAEALGYSNPRKAMSDHIDDEDKVVTKCDTPGGCQHMTAINESGLYSLILNSKLPSAKKFKHWITAEVLPALRENGGYIVGQENMNEDEFLARAVIVAQRTIDSLKNKCKELATEVEGKTKLIEELTPKATYYDVILASPDLLTTTEISKDYGMSAATFNTLLNELGIQYKQSKRWFLYSKYEGYGYAHSKPHPYKHKDGTIGTKTHMYWTQKGRLFLYEFLKKREIIPMIERGI